MALLFLIFVFFKQKTAYEMRISDWSSDVCSSDLTGRYGTTSLPVFGLWSDGDFALAESQIRNSQRQVTGPWRYQPTKGAPHCLQTDRAAEVNRLLRPCLPPPPP